MCSSKADHPSIPKPATFGANHQPAKGKSDWGFLPRLGRAAAAIAADGKWVLRLQTRIVVGFEYGLRKRETLSCRFMPAAGREFSEAALILKRRSDSRSVLTMPPES
jgi:hypothetical protein